MKIENKIAQIREIFSMCINDPDISNRKIAKELGISKTIVGKFRDSAAKLELTVFDIQQMSDEEISKSFNVTSKKVGFVEPEWEDIRKYLQNKRSWGNKLPTVHNAWVQLYIKVYFPNYTSGELPPACMSERTFDRRYADYMTFIGLSRLCHSPNPNNNFGPGSVMEIDTIGDKFPYVTRAGIKCFAVMFTAILKFSDKGYAEAMSSGSSLNWAHAISNAFYYFGGVTEVVRCDNDAALTNHHCKEGQKRLLATIEFVLKDFEVAVDLCPVRRPEYKGSNERHNSFYLKHLFEEELHNGPIVADSIEELNELIRRDLIRINSLPTNHGDLSRDAIFEKYEKDALQPLPLFRPEIKSVSFGYVKLDGYVKYLNHYYFAGFNNTGRNILIKNDNGKRIYLLTDDAKMTNIADYEIDKDATRHNYHKADMFKSQKENIAGRKKEFFISYFNGISGHHENIIATIEWLFTIFASSNQVATRFCNQIYNLYTKYPEDLDCLEATCKHLLVKKNKTDIRGQINTDYKLYTRIKDLGNDIFANTVGKSMNIESKSNQQKENTADTEKDGGSVRGEDYFNELC